MERVAGYHLHELLGRGRQGVVYRAVSETGLTVALKRLSSEHAGDASAQLRLRREARATSRVDHPNVVALIETGSHAGEFFQVSEYVDGPSLADVLQVRRVLPQAQVVSIARDVAAGLAAIHAAGFMHCDIKPGNILLDGHRAKIADLGLARALAAEAVRTERKHSTGGTPRYMAPEAIRADRPLDLRCDLYALGVVMYTALAGVPPHAADSVADLFSATMDEQPRPLVDLCADIHPDVVRLVEMLLSKTPEGRPDSADLVVVCCFDLAKTLPTSVGPLD